MNGYKNLMSIIVILCHLLHYLHKKCIQLHNCLSSITHTMYIWFSLSLSPSLCEVATWQRGMWIIFRFRMVGAWANF